jgi:hypothetical protein
MRRASRRDDHDYYHDMTLQAYKLSFPSPYPIAAGDGQMKIQQISLELPLPKSWKPLL